MKDWYAILGVEAGCTAAGIEEAYRKLQARYQPGLDAHDPYFENRFSEIQQAYEVLGNPATRSRYDQQLTPALPMAIDEKRRVKKYYSTTKGLNLGLTLMLGALLLVFGYHVVKLLSGSKTAKAAAPVKSAWVAHKPKRHKRKHWSWWAKTRPVTTAPKAVADTAKPHAPATALPVKTAVNYSTAAVSQPKTVAAEPRPKVSAPAPVETHTENEAAYLYETTIRGNETGVVHMRRYDRFNAELVKVIPSDSRVYLLERGGSYYKVMFDNTVGYVPKWTLQTK